jgi:competence protein ComEC
VFVSIAVGLFLKQKILRICVPAVMSFASLLLLCFATTSFYNQGTTVAAIDVGQGQCIVVMHDEYTAMIDCGGSNDSGNIAAKWLLSHGRDCVDAMFVTHFDVDHTNGIENLISQVPVENVYYCTLNLSEYESEQLMLLNAAMERYNVKTHLVNRSTKMFVGEMDIQLYIPQRPKNNDGMMVLLGINGYDVLVTGDTDIDIEEEMMRYVHLPDGECLVAGHHGSKYSTSEVLLDAFKPEAALISCGYNSYGHPTQEVLDRLNDRNVIIYRTDMLGTVELKVR